MKYSATQMAKKLGISRSNLYHLKDVGAVKIGVDENGKVEWTDDVFHQLEEYLQKRHAAEATKEAELPYRIFKINNRRFLGNKYKLLPFITRVVEAECENVNTVADIFAGTGAVASAFTDKKLITNDIMYSNYICHLAWFGAEPYSQEKVINLIQQYNDMRTEHDNYMSENFADTYFSLEDCRKIGYIRQDIEDKYVQGELNARERALLITSLLYAMDRIANTCGHYDAYRRGTQFEKRLELSVPQTEACLNENNICFNMDTNELVKEIEADLVYIDPPYNSRQYCDAYHLLENVARWQKPEVFGVARKMDRSSLKSDYCTQKAAEAFEELINTIHAKYIILSYNNMAEKGNDRSNAKISDDDIMRILQKKGMVKIFAEDYRTFSAGKSNIQENQERLFLCICHGPGKEVIPSALNYTGGKYKLLPQILPLFPKDMDRAVDMFCGGCNVGINLNCSKVQFNDNNEYLTGLLRTFQKLPKQEIFTWLFDSISRYKLSLVSENGYQYYGCDSKNGVGPYNREGYYRLRDDFNSKTERDDEYYLMLYLLIVYSFNNQLRFNQRGRFNLPVGKRDFNAKMQKKLNAFLDRLKSGDYQFTSGSFLDINLDEFTEESFFYADPPYLITCATYNEQSGWTEDDERNLLNYLEELDRRGIRFARSNVLESKGRRNEILADWLAGNDRFTAVLLDYDYSNSNYQTKKSELTREILVVNYEIKM